MKPIQHRRWRVLALLSLVLLLPACATDGSFSIFGYTTKPNFRDDVRTVRIPIFKNRSLYKGIEFDLTKEVGRALEKNTPYKVVGQNDLADTELVGTIVYAQKQILLRNQQNTIREGQTVMVVDLVWRDLRTGEILSSPRIGPAAPPINRQLAAPPLLMPQNAPGAPPIAANPPGPQGPQGPAPMVRIQSYGTFIPELGESLTTAFQENVNRMAVQIISMMEQPW